VSLNLKMASWHRDIKTQHSTNKISDKPLTPFHSDSFWNLIWMLKYFKF